MTEQQLQNLLNSLKADMILYKDLLKETAADVIAEEFSHFPIFVAHQLTDAVPIGENILNHQELSTTWSINVSTLTEFLEKGLIRKDREEFFRETYKDPKEFGCFFLIDEGGGHFVFVPYG